MKLEDQIRNAIERHTVDDALGAWDDVQQMFVRAHRRRAAARATLGAAAAVVLFASIAVVGARLGGAPKASDGFANTPEIGSFRYTSTISSAGSDDPSNVQTLTAQGAVDLRNGVRREVVKDQWEAIETRDHVLLRMADAPEWGRAPRNLADAMFFAGEDPFGVLAHPAKALEKLTTVSQKVMKAGADVVGGVTTTKYRATLDVEKLATRAGSDGAFLRAAFKNAKPVFVWIRGDGVLLKLDFEFDLTYGDRSGYVHRTVTLSDFDTPVAVTLPSTIARDFDSLLEGIAANSRTCSITSSAELTSSGGSTQPQTRTTCK